MTRELTLEEIKDRYNGYLTVGELKKELEKFSDDAKVLAQRVEDRYFENHNWGAVKKKGFMWHSQNRTNQKMLGEIESRKQGIPTKYPRLEDPSKYIVDLDESWLEQYIPVFCKTKFEDDENLYLNLHY